MDQHVRRYECPSLPQPKCSWKGTWDELRTHFKQDHPKLCFNKVKFPNYSSIQIQRNMWLKDSQQNILLIYRNDTFLLQIKNDKKQEKCWCGVRYIDRKDDIVVWKLSKRGHAKRKAIESFCFRVAFSSSDQGQGTQLVKRPGKMQSDDDWGFDTNSMLQCDINSVAVEDRVFSLCFTIYRKSELVHLEEIFIKELPCFNCKRVAPTVLLCEKGHPVCNSCKSNRCSFGGRQPCNCAVSVVKNVRYACENETIGCVFTGTQDWIQMHEKNCLVIPLCLAVGKKKSKVCEFSGSLYNWWCHLRREHHDQTARPKEPFQFVLDKTSLKHSVFMLEFGTMFKISYQVDRSGGLAVWTCQQIGLKAGEEQSYLLEIQVFYSTDEEPHLKGRVKCCFQTAEEQEQNSSNCLKFPCSLLEPFVVYEPIILVYEIVTAK